MPFKLNTKNKLQMETDENGQTPQNISEAINPKNVTTPDLYEAYGVKPESGWKHELQGFFNTVIPGVLGGLANRNQEGGWGRGMAIGTMQGLQGVQADEQAQDLKLIGQKDKILQSPELVSAYQRAKAMQEAGMFPQGKTFQDVLGDQLRDSYETMAARKLYGTGLPGLLMNPKVGNMDVGSTLDELRRIRAAGASNPAYTVTTEGEQPIKTKDEEGNEIIRKVPTRKTVTRKPGVQRTAPPPAPSGNPFL